MQIIFSQSSHRDFVHIRCSSSFASSWDTAIIQELFFQINCDLGWINEAGQKTFLMMLQYTLMLQPRWEKPDADDTESVYARTADELITASAGSH